MSTLEAERFEPVYLELEPARPTEYGKRWLEQRYDENERFNATLRDVAVLALSQRWEWGRIERQLKEEGVPTAVISSGLSRYSMGKLIDHVNGKTSFTMPATVTMALMTAAPTSATTGVLGANEAAYTGYARQTLAGSVFGAAVITTDPVLSTSASTITFGACTALTSTLLGFIIADNATVNTGNALWYGSLTSTVISTTQTPPTVASGALVLSATGT